MSSTRINNDVTRMEDIQNSCHNTLNYMINVPGNGSKPDFINDPHIRLQKFGANLSSNLVDINSDLKGINRQLTKEGTSLDSRDPIFNNTYNKHYFPSHDKAITDEPRSTAPAWQVRDLEQNNWDYLPNNPQQHTELSFQNNIDTRRLDKDSYDMQCRNSLHNE